MIPGSFPISVGSNSFIANAVHYNGSTDYLTLSTALTGAVAGPQATINVWVKQATNGTIIFTLNNSEYVALQTTSISNTYNASGRKSGPTVVYQVTSSTATVPPATTWHNVIASWDVNTASGAMILDGIDVTGISGFGTGNMLWTATNAAVAGLSTGSGLYSGDMAELFVDQRYLDLSIPGNVAKFFDSSGKPAYLGVNGELVFGTPPLIYLSNPAGTINVNQGSGGDFTIHGTPTTATTSPSD